jgi:hypothetical protein
MARPASIFEGLDGEERENLPFLLDRFYSLLGGDLDRMELQFKGKLAEQQAEIRHQESELKKQGGRLQRIEYCPCAVHRDPAHTCPVLDMKEAFNDEIGKIRRRLSWWAGGFTFFLGAVHLVAYFFWPLLRR